MIVIIDDRTEALRSKNWLLILFTKTTQSVCVCVRVCLCALSALAAVVLGRGEFPDADGTTVDRVVSSRSKMAPDQVLWYWFHIQLLLMTHQEAVEAGNQQKAGMEVEEQETTEA